jgi:probable blue pigment (indigoidine) exporter
MSRPAHLVGVWWITCLLWSSTFLFLRIGLQEIRPLTFAWCRLAIALIVLAPLAMRQRRRRSAPAAWAHIAGAGVLLLGVNYAVLFWGARLIPSGLVATLQSGTPLIALLFGWAAGSERLTTRRVIALAAGAAGVALIYGTEARSDESAAAWGVLAVLLSSVCVAAAYVWLKTASPGAPPIVTAAVQSVSAVIPLATLAVLTEGVPDATHWSPATWSALLYLALAASVAAVSLNYWLLARMDASSVLLMGVAEVPIAIALGAIVLDERLPPGTLAGTAIILLAVVLRLRDRGTTS